MESQENVNDAERTAASPVEHKMTFCERLNFVRKNITVEPVAFLIIFAGIFSLVASQSMGLQKACRVNLALGDEICEALRLQNQTGNYSHYERMVQEYISKQVLWTSALQTLLPCVMLLFVGGWSDKTGRRKAIMLLCIGGQIMLTLNHIINVVFFDQIRLEIFFFFDIFFVGIVGGTSVTFLAIFNYICDITNEENRTYRLGFVSLCTFSGMPLGLSLSGIVLKHFGFYTVFGVSGVLHVVNFIYVVFVISDMARSKEQRMNDNRGLCHLLKTFFNPVYIKSTIAVVTKKTENNRRLQLMILLVAITFLYGPVNGETAILYMNSRYRFNWDDVDYSIFQTYSFLVNMVGTVISLMLFSKYLKWHDSLLGITATASKILSSPVYAFAGSTVVFYMGPIANILSGAMISLLAVRSLYSKLLEPHEIGKMTSLIGLLENLTPLMYLPIYSKIYINTMDTLPGTIFLFGAIMTVPAFLAFIWLFRMHKNEVRRKKFATPAEVDIGISVIADR